MVSCDLVHDAFASGWQNLLAQVPAGDRDSHLDRQQAELLGAIPAQEDHLSDLLVEFDRNSTPSLLAPIRRLEEELRTMRELLEDVENRQAMADGGIIHTRLGALAEAIEVAEDGDLSVNAGPINTVLKVLFDAVVIDHHVGRLEFHWRQGGVASIVYAWVDTEA